MPIATDPVEILQVRKLLHCVRTEDYPQIKKLCEKGVQFLINFNEPQEGLTALILAAIMNNEAMMKFLLQNGAHPNIVDLKGRSPLMRGAEYGHVQALTILKEARADASLRDLEGKDALFYCLSAPTNRHDQCVQIILSMMGAMINNKTKDGVPVFVEACKNAKEYEAICLMFLEAGCDPSALEEKTQRSALHYAAASGSVAVCRAILQKGGNPNVLDKHKLAPAHEAAYGGHFEVLTVLSAYGAHFDVYDQKENNPIHFAAFSNSGSCCRYLATRGCNPKTKNLEGKTPKAIAKEKKNKDAGKNIRKGEKQYAKLSKQTVESGGINWSIRLYDYMYEHKERIKEAFLKNDPEQTGKITKDAFIEVIAKQGFENLVETEEMKKLIMSHEKVKDEIDYELFLTGKKYINKQFLISSFEKKKKKKKKKKAKARKGKTKIPIPILVLDDGPRQEGGDPPAIYQPQHIHFTDISRFNRDKPPVHPLQDDSAWYLRNPDEAFVNVCNAAHQGDVRTLLNAFKRGLPVDMRDKYYKTPLMVAAANGDIETCKFLLACQADINAYDNFKWTALHHACHTGQLETVKLLVEKGANINALTITEATPFMRAVESASYPVVEYLMSLGCKVNQENKSGKSAFDLAKDYADPRVYFAVKNKFESLPKPKDGKKKKKKPKKKPNKKKKDEVDTKPKRDSFLPTIEMKPKQYPNAEKLLEQELGDRDHIIFRPLHYWTEQDTTDKVLEKKQMVRERFGWEFDFEDFKLPFMKNAKMKVDKLGGIET